MNEILAKISSYNIFNYLLPGALFAAIGDRYSSFSFIQNDFLIALFSYYFYGLIISRIGSLLLQPLLIRCKFLVFDDYSNFVSASKVDPKLDVLSESNNVYRTLSALMISLLALFLVDRLIAHFPCLNEWIPYILVSTLCLLFLVSWRKQTALIVSRISNTKIGDKN